MRRFRWLALIVVIAAVAMFWPDRPAVREPGDGEDPYVPLELPADVQARLVVWDHPWPHADPIADPSRFQGEAPEPWAQRLADAVSAFARRFPGVEVVVEVRPFRPGPGDTAGAPAGSEGGAEAPDVIAVWWGGPLPPLEELVPLDPYLTEAVRAEYHPAAWSLVEAGGSAWGWPRWLAFHYWLAPGTADAPASAGGWTIDAALPVAAAEGLLAPPAGGGLLLELAAGRGAPLTPPPAAGAPRDGAPGDGAPGVGDAASGGEMTPNAVVRLAEVLGRLRPLLAAGDGVGQRLTEARFGLAAGFGPAVGHWAVSPPWSGRSRTDEQALRLLPPPAALGEPAAAPVLSPGAYVVLRKAGPGERVRAQLAMELARHLSTWEVEAAVARLLALPAHQPALARWQAQPPLAAAAAQRLLRDLEQAAAQGLRVYGRPDPAAAPLDPAVALDWWRRWLAGELTDQTLARLLLGSAAPSPARVGAGAAAP